MHQKYVFLKIHLLLRFNNQYEINLFMSRSVGQYFYNYKCPSICPGVRLIKIFLCIPVEDSFAFFLGLAFSFSFSSSEESSELEATFLDFFLSAESLSFLLEGLGLSVTSFSAFFSDCSFRASSFS